MFRKTPGGEWHYHPPGLVKKPGTLCERVLGSTCRLVGCPANCGPHRSAHIGPRAEGFVEFEKLGWPVHLRKIRKGARVDWYRAICEFERRHDLAPGAPLIVSFAALAELAGRAKTHANENLRGLYHLGLLTEPRTRKRKWPQVQ